MLDERDTANPVPVITTLLPELPEFARTLPEADQQRLRELLAEAEHETRQQRYRPSERLYFDEQDADITPLLSSLYASLPLIQRPGLTFATTATGI